MTEVFEKILITLRNRQPWDTHQSIAQDILEIKEIQQGLKLLDMWNNHELLAPKMNKNGL